MLLAWNTALNAPAGVAAGTMLGCPVGEAGCNTGLGGYQGGSGGLGLFVDLSEMTTDSQVGPDDILFVNNGGSGQSVYDSWAEDAEQYGAQAGVDPELVLAIALKESDKYRELGGGTYNSLWNVFEMGAVLGTAQGWWPHGGASLGVSNIKPAVYATLQQYAPKQFGNVPWSELATSQSPDIEATAYYAAYIEKTYVDNTSAATGQVERNYTTSQIVEGIYNGGESNYENVVLETGRFGPQVSSYINGMSSYDSWAQQLLSSVNSDSNGDTSRAPFMILY